MSRWAISRTSTAAASDGGRGPRPGPRLPPARRRHNIGDVLFEEREDGLIVDVKVVPRASRTAIGPVAGDRLRVAVTAPPVDGAANAAVVQALADAFGV